MKLVNQFTENYILKKYRRRAVKKLDPIFDDLELIEFNSQNQNGGKKSSLGYYYEQMSIRVARCASALAAIHWNRYCRGTVKKPAIVLFDFDELRVSFRKGDNSVYSVLKNIMLILIDRFKAGEFRDMTIMDIHEWFFNKYLCYQYLPKDMVQWTIWQSKAIVDGTDWFHDSKITGVVTNHKKGNIIAKHQHGRDVRPLDSDHERVAGRSGANSSRRTKRAGCAVPSESPLAEGAES